MKFFGEVGYGDPVETPPNSGVWVDQIIEKQHQGDVIRNVKNIEKGDKLNSDITVSNSISIVADAYISENFFKIKYIKWMNARWTVTSVEVRHPRLILNLGEVYNGPTP